MTEETGRYRTPGELVQAAREQKGLSLKDLASETRIPLRMIEAIEADDFAAISNPLYARSFLKAIGDELHLETDLLLERYDRLTEPDDMPLESTDDPTWETETRVLHTETMAWRLPLMVVAVVVTAALLVWGAIKIFSGSEKAPAEAIAASAEQVEPTRPSSTQVDTIYNVAYQESLLLPVGDPSLEFADGSFCDHVLRLVCRKPEDVEITLKVDDVHDPVVIDWEQATRGVPDSGVVSGRVYHLNEEHIIYWCAAERFRVVVPDDRWFELRYNGQVIDFTPEDLGRELIFGDTGD